MTTPENWHWDITPEDVKKIKAVDRETINRVYFSNLAKFKNIAGRYCFYIIRDSSYFEDCVQQIYVDLDKFDYTNVQTFYWSILNSCRRARCASFREVSLFTPVITNDKGKDKTLLDILWKDYFAELEERETGEEKALLMIKSQTALSELEKDFLTAIAFCVRPYEGLFNDEYKNYTARIAG